MESGLPQNSVQALLQTRDGYLWVGTEAGLARFDGSGFRVFDRSSHQALPGNDVRCLFEAPDGALWIGTSEGLARWKDGAATAFTTLEGLPGNSVRTLRSGDRGSVIVSTQGGEAEILDGRVVPVTGNHPEPTNPVAHVNLTVEFPDGHKAQATTTVVSMMQSGSDERLKVGKELPGSRIQALLADREGSLWIATNSGLSRWTMGKVESFPAGDLLGAASILSLFEDREGDLWVGTENDGLYVLRDQRFRTLGTREGLSSDATTTVVEDAAGALWVGTQGDGLNGLRIGRGDARAVRSISVTNGLASNVILSLAAGANGALWVGTPDGLNRIVGDHISTFTSADGLPDDFIRSLLIDPDGSLWIGTRRGLAHWMMSSAMQGATAPPHIVTYTQANGLGSDLVGAMARDTNGDLWIATLAGLSRLHAGHIENFTTANGLSSNVITALLPRDDATLLIGTQDHGWDEWDDHRFLAVVQGGLDRNSIHAILDDRDGHLWLATDDGIARCDCQEVSRPGPAELCTHLMELGTADGMRSRETATNSHPSAWRSRDGHLWFATPKGLIEVDPAHFPVNTLPPPVAIERFAVDDSDEPTEPGNPLLRIAAGHVHFQFDYAGLSFVAPQKVRYRYILQGFDRNWTEAGSRRVAYYTNIPPGRYTFRVQASNSDGVWNTTGTVLQFELRPRFYQTLWFYALLLATVFAAVVLLVQLRLRLADSEFRAVLGERNRIAREIHDTLAQGYAGISVQLEILAELLRLHKLEAAVKQLDRTRENVREGLADARQSIWALRTHDTGDATLPVKLRRMTEGVSQGGMVSEFRLFGVYRPLPAEFERELLRVAQEATHNVKQHAMAKHLFVQLEYGPETIALEIRDDGRGGARIPAVKSTLGHFGLTGMRERAAAIGGTLEVMSEPGQGTTIRLSARSPIESSKIAGAQ